MNFIAWVVVCSISAVAVLTGPDLAMADEYLNVDLDFISYERVPLCDDCGWLSLEWDGSERSGHGGDEYDMVVLEILVENHGVDYYEDYMLLSSSRGLTGISGLSVYVYDSVGDWTDYKRSPTTSILPPPNSYTHHEYSSHTRATCDSFLDTYGDQEWSDECHAGMDAYELEKGEYERQVGVYNMVVESETHHRCADSKLSGSIPDGESKEITLCFLIPRSVVGLGYLAMKYNGNEYYQFVFLDERGCEDANRPERCGGSWDLDRVIVDDGIYEYTIADTSLYELEVPGFTDMLEVTARNALKMWSDANLGIEFVLVDDKESADFNILMGGTGETRTPLGGISDTWGRVNDIGCLVEHDIDCTMTIYVENRHANEVVLLSQTILGYTILHETGHLLGLPHHPSALHAMHNPNDANVQWYDPDEYDFVAPAFKYPETEVRMCVP